VLNQIFDESKDIQQPEVENNQDGAAQCQKMTENDHLDNFKLNAEDQELFLKRKREADRPSEGEVNFNMNNNTKAEGKLIKI
jgi:hypothetical protein